MQQVARGSGHILSPIVANKLINNSLNAQEICWVLISAVRKLMKVTLVRHTTLQSLSHSFMTRYIKYPIRVLTLSLQ